METNPADLFPQPEPPSSSSFKSPAFPADDPSSQLDLYTIPTHSCWFSWDSIHETERTELPEFFNNTSFTRSVKIYKDYRDFIISKYREDPHRRLTFTELRKSLVGDVCVLRKVFNFLDNWGLINFGAPPPPPPPEVVEDDGGVRVRVEEGAPVGVRVIVAPSSSKLLVPPVKGVATSATGGGGDGDYGGGYKAVPPLASYSDVFREVRCRSCKHKCDNIKYYECTKEKCVICSKCFEKGAFGENRTKDDFIMNDSAESDHNQGSVWTDAETLLLLESILKHGDDWELVAQSVQTKTRHECISRLIELPFGELMLGSREKLSSRVNTDLGYAGKDLAVSSGAGPSQNLSTATAQVQKAVVDASQEQRSSSDAGQEQNNLNDSRQEMKASNDSVQEHKTLGESLESTAIEDNHQQPNMNNHQQQSLENQCLSITQGDGGGDLEIVEPLSKKNRIDTADPSRSLMEQVALISTMVGSQITAAAASAAVSVLSDGNPVVRDIFYVEDQAPTVDPRLGNLDMELERVSEDSEMKDASHSSEVDKLISVREPIPLALRTRAVVGTALGAAAAHARFLADQEEREIEHLVAFIIENQMKKLECKIKIFEDLEQLMEKEHTVLEETKDSIIAQRMEILDRIFGAGISRLRDYNSLRLLSGSV